MEQALTIDQAAYGPGDLLVARDLDKLGAVLREAGDLAGAQDCLERAAAIREREGSGQPDDL
jgi:Tetratricopeptide repeat